MVNCGLRSVKLRNVFAVRIVTIGSEGYVLFLVGWLALNWIDEHMTPPLPPPEDFFHVKQDDEEYVQMLREEEEFWDGRIETLLTKTPGPAVQRYVNERLTGDAEKLWYQTIGDEGEFTSGCVFGAGPGQVEEDLLARHPQVQLTIFDISGEALSRLQTRLDERYAGRAETRQQDLNFVDLPTEAYDLAVANSSIHHLVNLEHFAFQVNNSLVPRGRFFMQDVVGESYFQFTEDKKRMFQMINNA